MAIEFRKAYYIKLGDSGAWEKDCIDRGILRLGYGETDHETCLSGNWEAVRNQWAQRRPSIGTATRDANQIRIFYEASSEDIFITFHDRKLFWCHPAGLPEIPSDGTGGRIRRTLNGWKSTTLGGHELTIDKLAGDLAKTQGFRGTICNIKLDAYLKRKLNDQLTPEAKAAEEAEEKFIIATRNLIKRLNWKDFEILVDLIFAASGFRRISAVGKAQDTIDIDLILPVTGERAFAQVKSRADNKSYDEYRRKFDESSTYQRMFFVWHTGKVDQNDDEDITLIGPNEIARMAIDAGLSSWLREKVS